ncbi:MAG: cytochrome c oxidase assembly protein, partial [Caulobacteraceae bacterium]
RRAAFHCGWILEALALISPLCPLSVSLFSARIGQHMILTTIAAPLIALGAPDRTLAAGWARLRAEAPPSQTVAASPVLAAAAFAAALWIWHAPGPYAATFQSDIVYWAMHITTFGSALWLWTALLNGPGERLPGAVAAIFLTTGQMGLLGAIITFAGSPLYWPHAFTTAAWGLTPLQDQQLGGVIMWVPAGILFVAGLSFAFFEAMRRSETRALTRHAS